MEKQTKEKLSLEELIKMNPEDMTMEQATQYTNIQKKASMLQSADMKLYLAQIDYKEAQAKEDRISKDRKVYALENMKATIEMEELFPAYQAAIASGNKRMEQLQSNDPTPPAPSPIITTAPVSE